MSKEYTDSPLIKHLRYESILVELFCFIFTTNACTEEEITLEFLTSIGLSESQIKGILNTRRCLKVKPRNFSTQLSGNINLETQSSIVLNSHNPPGLFYEYLEIKPNTPLENDTEDERSTTIVTIGYHCDDLGDYGSDDYTYSFKCRERKYLETWSSDIWHLPGGKPYNKDHREQDTLLFLLSRVLEIFDT